LQSTGCKPIADIDSFTEDKLGSADLVEEVQTAGSRIVKVTGVKNAGHTVSIVCRGANALVLDEAERSLHDAICVIRCLVKKKCVYPFFFFFFLLLFLFFFPEGKGLEELLSFPPPFATSVFPFWPVINLKTPPPKIR
jgi:hypothetical protein